MNDLTPASFVYTDGDTDTNRTDTVTLNELAAQRLSRRQTLRGGSAILAATLGGSALAACDSADVENVPAPTVSAGAATTTTAGRVVTLTGTSDASAVAWTQTGGPAVTLNGAGGATATFLAPSVASATVLTFQFAAATGNSATTATTTVTVNPAVLGFTAVAKNKLDIVSVPAGYKVQVINRLGDPIAAGVAAYKNDGTDTNFAQRIGDHGDALYWYGLSATGTRDDASSTRGLIVQNHENITSQVSPSERPDRGAAPRRRSDQGDRVPRRERDRGFRKCEPRLVDQPEQQLQPPHHAEHSDGVQRPGARIGPAQDALFADRRGGPRHDQQLRQRRHALGHQPDLRRELGGLFPPKRRCRAHRQGDHLVRPLRHLGDVQRQQQLVDGGSGRRQRHALPPLGHPRDRRDRDRRLPQRSQPARLGGRDRSVQPRLDAAQAHRARPSRP